MKVTTDQIHTHPYCVITYVLELENNKWYVGKTTNLNRRLCEHFSPDHKASIWTDLHKPIDVHEWVVGDLEVEKFFEYMTKYGFANVRGSYWCREKQPYPDVSTIDEYYRFLRYKHKPSQHKVFRSISNACRGITISALLEDHKKDNVINAIDTALEEPALVVVNGDFIVPIPLR